MWSYLPREKRYKQTSGAAVGDVLLGGGGAPWGEAPGGGIWL